MIEYRINGGRMERLESSGSYSELIADIGLLVGLLHSGIYRSNPAYADVFRRGVLCLLQDDSPVWRPDKDVQGIFITKGGPKCSG